MISPDLINKKISVTLMSGDRRQGNLISIDQETNESPATFTINWKKDPKESQFFRTTLRMDRVESVTELIRPPRAETVPVRVDGEGDA